MIRLTSSVVATQNHATSALGDEVVILDFGSSAYYGVDGVGVAIWSMVQRPVEVTAIRDALLETYEVDADQCEQDLIAFLEELAADGLVEVQDVARP